MFERNWLWFCNFYFYLDMLKINLREFEVWRKISAVINEYCKVIMLQKIFKIRQCRSWFKVIPRYWILHLTAHNFEGICLHISKFKILIFTGTVMHWNFEGFDFCWCYKWQLICKSKFSLKTFPWDKTLHIFTYISLIRGKAICILCIGTHLKIHLLTMHPVFFL